MNHLINEKSPYLLQHAENPVNWYPWCKEAFDRAEAEDKPVFLSIGYSTCHWCHVMAHESFENNEIAEILNKEYIAVKVDREERPDIDAVYMNVCQAVTGSGGWPLTVILTPSQNPFFVGTYFPRNSLYGQAGLMDILRKIAFMWKNQKEDLLNAGADIVRSIFHREEQEQVSGTPSQALLETGADILSQNYDKQYGGFGQAPKFPVPHNLMFLMRYGKVRKNDAFLSMVKNTLYRMGVGGIFDHIGGGFSRYSTDSKWLIPHFEKMLYDNALLAVAYMEAYQLTKDNFYKAVARKTLDYMIRELKEEDGGFFCGQDADSEGVEGKYYYFTPDEIMDVLGSEKGKEFCSIYDITDNGNFDGKSIPNLIAWKDKNESFNKEKAQEEWEIIHKKTKESRERLYRYRKERTHLHRDDKVILSWNGWAIIAMAMGGQIFNDERYKKAAEDTRRFIAERMTDENGRLFLRWRDKEAACEGSLDDYAVYGLALLKLYEMAFDTSYLKEAVLRGEQLEEFFKDKETGGYYLTPSDGEKLISRPKETYDGAVPSGNSAAAVFLGRLSRYTGDIRWKEASKTQNYFIAGAMGKYPYGHSLGLVALMEALYPSKELVCVTAEGGIPKEVAEYISENTDFNLSLILKTKENAMELADIAPYTKDYPIPREGCVYYLCQNGECKRPETSFGTIRKIINTEEFNSNKF